MDQHKARDAGAGSLESLAVIALVPPTELELHRQPGLGSPQDSNDCMTLRRRGGSAVTAALQYPPGRYSPVGKYRRRSSRIYPRDNRNWLGKS
jgi:hypothetical protein